MQNSSIAYILSWLGANLSHPRSSFFLTSSIASEYLKSFNHQGKVTANHHTESEYKELLYWHAIFFASSQARMQMECRKGRNSAFGWMMARSSNLCGDWLVMIFFLFSSVPVTPVTFSSSFHLLLAHSLIFSIFFKRLGFSHAHNVCNATAGALRHFAHYWIFARGAALTTATGSLLWTLGKHDEWLQWTAACRKVTPKD